MYCPKPQEKIKAEYLIVVEGKQQKEICKILGVSEKTISGWATKGKWKEKRNAREETLFQIETSLSGFLSYLNAAAPNIHFQVLGLKKSYLKLLRI